MTMREQFLQVVKNYGIDEVWVNFDEALNHSHVEDGETYLIYKKDAYLGDENLCYANYDIMEIFAPTLKDIDVYNVKDSDEVNLSYMIVPELDSNRMTKFEKRKKDGFRLLYRKGDGIIR